MYKGNSPAKIRRTFSTAVVGTAAIDSRVWPIICRVKIALGRERRGLSKRRGSVANVSMTIRRSDRSLAISYGAPDLVAHAQAQEAGGP